MTFETAITLLLLLIALLLAVLLHQGRRRDATIAALNERLEGRIEDATRHLFDRLEGYLSLRDRLDLRRGLPYTPDWSAAPDFLRLIVDHALTARPATIVECSSGLTSLMLARCCELNGGGALFSLENGVEYAARTRDEITRYGLDGYATIIHAPLRPWSIGGREYQWYALDDLPQRSIEMLVIDGPPGFLQHHSRYPALPLLAERLADGCVIFMDDAARADEREIVSMWQALLPGVEHEYLATERGCSVLRIRRGGD